jgi:arsenate reductase
LRHDAGNVYEVSSAGINPTHVRPEAIAVMREVGIDISGHRSKSVEEFAGQEFDYVITVCDNAKESCPVFPVKTKRIHWSIEDPAAAQGSKEERWPPSAASETSFEHGSKLLLKAKSRLLKANWFFAPTGKQRKRVAFDAGREVFGLLKVTEDGP